MTGSTIPEYFVYGEPSRAIEVGFLHVERVRDRNNLHRGHVAPHKHAHMGQFTFWTSGTGAYHIEDARWKIAAPAVSFVPSKVVHGFDIEDDADAIVVSVADEMLAPLRHQAGHGVDGPMFATGDTGPAWLRMRTLFETILAEYRERAATADPVLVALLGAISAYVRRADSGRGETGRSAELELALAFRDLVDRHYRDAWSVERYIEELATTRHLLAKAVRQVLAKSVKEAITDRRLLEAKRLLLFTVRPVEDIAYEIGFSDAAYFARFFRLRCGASPTDWRQGNAGRFSV